MEKIVAIPPRNTKSIPQEGESEYNINNTNEHFVFGNQKNGANYDRKNFYKDIEKLESLVKKSKGAKGYAIFLTNRSDFWNSTQRKNPIQKYPIRKGTQIKTQNGGKYVCAWENLPVDEFKYLVIEVKSYPENSP